MERAGTERNWMEPHGDINREREGRREGGGCSEREM